MLTPLLLIAVIAIGVTLGPGIVRRWFVTPAVPNAVTPTFIAEPTRTSNTLTLRLPTMADRDFYLEMAADPTAAEANGWAANEVAESDKWFSTPELFERFRHGELVAIETATGERIGTTRVAASPIGSPGARSIGIHVHPDHRRRGFGRAIMAEAIQNLQLSPAPLYVGTAVTNHGLQRIMNSLGFVPNPDTRAYTAPNGETFSSLWYDCTNQPVG